MTQRFSFTFFFLAFAGHQSFAATKSYSKVCIGKAHSLKSKEFVYQEAHKTKYLGKAHQSTETIYTDSKGKQFAKLISNYSKSAILPEYRFDDSRFQRFDEVKHKGEQLELSGKGGKKKKVKEYTLKKKNQMVTGQGMHHYIQANLEQFSNSEQPVKMKFVIPIWGDYYSMRLRKKAINLEAGLVDIVIEIDNWFLRLFAPEINVTYNLKTKDLVTYKGASNLVSDSGKKQDVLIKYEPCVVENQKI